MKVLIDSGPYAPSNGQGYVDYTKYVIDGSINVEDSINVPTLTTFDVSAVNDAFVLPSRSCYVRIVSDYYTGPSVLNVLGTSMPWNGADTTYSYHITAPGTAATQTPVTPGQVLQITYLSGLVNAPNKNNGYYTDGIGGPGNTSSGVNPWPSDRYAHPGGGQALAGEMAGAFVGVSGNVISPFYIGDGVTVTVPAGAVALTIGVNTYEVWNTNSGSWNVQIRVLGKSTSPIPLVLATGFVTNQPEPEFLGMNHDLPSKSYQQIQYTVKVTSDEWVLNSNTIPYIPAFVNQTDSQILAAIANALMPGFFDTSFMASGNLIPYYQYDPTQTWSDIAKTFADSNRYWYKVMDKKIHYQPFNSTPLGISYDETVQTQSQLYPIQLKTSVVSVPPVNDCIVLGDTEPQNNVDSYFIGDGFTSNFQLKHQVFQGTSSQLLADDWTESSFQTGSWIVNDPLNQITLADSGGNAAGALNVIQKGAGSPVYTPLQNATYVQAHNGIELGGGLNLQHGQITFNDTAVNGGGLIGGIFTQSPVLDYNPIHCMAGFQVQGQPSIGSFTVVSVSASASIHQVQLTINGTNSALHPGNVFSAAGFGGASFLNGQNLYILSITQAASNYTLTCGAQNPGIIINYGPASDSGSITFGANSVITTASGAAGIYVYPLYNGSITGSPVVSTPNHQYVLQTWIGAEAPNRFTRPYTNLTRTTTYGAQNLAASGSITWVITDVNIGNYVIEQQYPLFGLFPAAPPPVVSKFTAYHQNLAPFGIYVLISGLDLNISVNYTNLSLPPQGYLTVQSLFGASGGNLPILPSKLSVPIPYQLGFGMVNQTAQVSQQGEAYALSFYTDDIPSVGARIRFQSWSAGQAIARVRDANAISLEAKVSGDSGVRAAIMANLSPLPRTSAECEAAAGAAILDREFPQFQGSYTIQTQPSFETLFNPGNYDYPHTGLFLYINTLARGVSGQNFFVNTVRTQVVETRGETLTVTLDYGPDLYLEKQLPSFLEREQNLLTPSQTAPTPPAITLAEVLNAKLPTLNSAQVLSMVDAPSGSYVVVDLSGGTEANAGSVGNVISSIGATGCEVRYVDNGWGVPNAGRVGIFTVDQFTLPRTSRDQAFYLRGIGGPIGGSGFTPLVSRYSKELRIAYPMVPSAPALVSSNPTTVVFDYNGDVRDIYGLELRVPSVGAVAFVSFAPGVPVDTIPQFTRYQVTGTSSDKGNASAFYGTVGTNGTPWAAHTPYPPGAIVSANSGGSPYLFQLQGPTLPTFYQQDGSPIPNTVTGDYVNLYFYNTTGNPNQFTPYGATAASAALHSKVNSTLFNIGGDPNTSLVNFALNQAGEVISASVPWGSSQNFSMVMLFSIYVPVAGTYNMLVNHDDGFFFGIDGGATRVSGPNSPLHHTTTSMNGYTILGGSDQNGSIQETYAISFPSAGRYNVEMDYFQYIHEETMNVLFGNPTTIGYSLIPVPSNSFPMSMASAPAWPSGLGATVLEGNTSGYQTPFGGTWPIGGWLLWKNIGAPTAPTPPPFQYQAGDIVYLNSQISSDFTEIILVTAAGSTPDYSFSWFDYNSTIHTVGSLNTASNAGTSQLVLRTPASWATTAGTISSNGTATITTGSSHSLTVGQFVIVSCGYTSWPGGTYGAQPLNSGAIFCGIYQVTAVPASNQFQYVIPNNPYSSGLPSVNLVGLAANFPETGTQAGGVVLQRVITAPADLVVDLTQPNIASQLDLIQAVIPGGRITGLAGYFFNLQWDYSLPTVVPSFNAPSVTGLVIDTNTQQILWGLAAQSGTPDGYRIEVSDQATGQFRNRYTIDHISNKQLLTQLQLTAADYANPITIKITPFDSIGDGIPAVVNWQGSGAGGGGGTGGTGTGGNTFQVSVTPPITLTQPTSNLAIIGISDFIGDTGTGGQRGSVPAPPAGSASGSMYLSASGTWAPVAVQSLPTLPYDIGCTWMGLLPASGIILHLPMSGLVGGGTTQVNFPVNFVGSEAHLLTASTGSITFNIYKLSAGVLTTIGTLAFTAGQKFGTFSVASLQTFTGGGSTPDTLMMLSPTVQDATASDLGFVIRGYRNNTGA